MSSLLQDEKYIQRCIELSKEALDRGDMPFGCVVVKDNQVISETRNIAHTTGFIDDHAEMLAMREAQSRLGTKDLSTCTFYSSFEPCPMCAFVMRELKFKRIVFSLLSKDMGGYSRWNILKDELLNKKYPHHFGPVPEVVTGILASDARAVWDLRDKNIKVLPK